MSDCRDMCEGEIIETVLNSRGIENVDHFLNPIDDDLLPLDSLLYIDEARKIIERGIDKGKRFKVFFDVDLDGVSSGTIMCRYLSHYTDKVSSHINIGKAHGLIGQDIEIFNDCDILIIVDSLDKDIIQYEKLKSSGIEIIVLDHHAINENIPYDKYVTLVSSQRSYKNRALSGAGVVWKFCKYLDEYFMEDYADGYVDLAACGILADVCDVSEQNYENRYIVHKGLCNLKNPAVKKIVGSHEFNSKAVLFSIAPLINACCRVGRNEIAMKLFLSDENKEILKLKKELEECREIQRVEVERLIPLVNQQIIEQKDETVLSLVIDTPYGIAGLIGNKILDNVNKPLFVTSWEDESCIGGSMRSNGCGDFRTLCNDINIAMLNGHEEASGFECDKARFDEFLHIIRGKISDIERTTSSDIIVDCEIILTDITRTLVDRVKEINFVSGAGFKPLTFKVTDIDEYDVGSFKQGKHLVLSPTDYIQLIEWNTDIDYEYMEECALLNEPIEVIGELDSGFFARKYMLKVIISDLKVVA